MGYADYLKTLLRPLGIYDLDSGYGAAELTAMGFALDGLEAVANTLENECVVGTATDYGLTKYEDILPKRPLYRNTATRRSAIEAFLTIDDMSFTAAALNAALAGCGIPAVAAETGTQFTVEVTFPGTKGIPDDADELIKRIESILPCHLEVTYVYVYLTWTELESAFSSWSRLEEDELTWSGLESYGSL